jgi:glyoxylase-like metal-dependent hydrolase (beta-lactamase superfamily II)
MLCLKTRAFCRSQINDYRGLITNATTSGLVMSVRNLSTYPERSPTQVSVFDARNLYLDSVLQSSLLSLLHTPGIMGLDFKVFHSTRPSATRTGPSGHDDLKWVPTSSTLIFGDRDAVLVDAQLTEEAAKELVSWVVAADKNITHIYVTHAHGDHFFGCGLLLETFPNAKVVATSEVVAGMDNELTPKRREFWNTLFPGKIPKNLVSGSPLHADQLELEGESLHALRVGHTDTDDTTILWVPSIGLAVVGDAVYANTHPYLGEAKSESSRLEWIAALDKIAALYPKNVVGGHSDPSKGYDPQAIEETKVYLQKFNRLCEETETAEELYHRLLDLYPKRINPGSAWAGASLVKKSS